MKSISLDTFSPLHKESQYFAHKKNDFCLHVLNFVKLGIFGE